MCVGGGGVVCVCGGGWWCVGVWGVCVCACVRARASVCLSVCVSLSSSRLLTSVDIPLALSPFHLLSQPLVVMRQLRVDQRKHPKEDFNFLTKVRCLSYKG